MTSQPAELGIQVINRIVDLSRNGAVDPFAIRAIRSQAENLKKADAFRAWIALGMLECLDGNEQEMRRCHEISINMYPYDAFANKNYAVSLMKFGYIGEACKYFDVATKSTPDDLEVLKKNIITSTMAGKIKRANDLANEYNKMSPQEKYEHTEFLTYAANLYDEIKISDEIAIPIYSLVYDLLREHHALNDFDFSANYINEVTPNYIDNEITINKPEEQVIDMNFILAENMTKYRDNPLTNHVVFTFTPKEPEN